METARAEIGDNYSRFFPEEKLPPKSQRIVSIDRARQVEIAARQVSALFRTPKSRIMEKRKGGEEGRALRRPLIAYARSIGCPVWECAILFDLNRKQIGQEEAAFLDMISDRPGLDKDWENMVTFLDYAAKVNVTRFITVSMAAIAQAKAEAKKAKAEAEESERLALQTIKGAVDALAAPLEQAKPKLPTPKPVSAETERLVAEGQRQRLAQARAQSIRMLNAIIAKGEETNATKEQQKDAKKAREALDELGEA